MVEGEGVACPVDDMEKVDCLGSCVPRRWCEGREDKGKGKELMKYLGHDTAWCSLVPVDGARLWRPRDTLACGRWLFREELRHHGAFTHPGRLLFLLVLSIAEPS